MYCPKCGAKNVEDSGFCVKCAEPLKLTGQDIGDMAPRIPSHLVPAILCTLFCCLPFGIVAIVHAAQVNPKISAGDYPGARDSSHKAVVWCWVSFGLGLVGILIYGFFYGLTAVMGRSQ
jgi:hypothetical protein